MQFKVYNFIDKSLHLWKEKHWAAFWQNWKGAHMAGFNILAAMFNLKLSLFKHLLLQALRFW